MSFKKGNSLGGRTPGSKGKARQKTKQAFNDLLENNLDKLQSDLDTLEPLQRLKIIIELASYIIPKQKSVESSIEVKQSVIPQINFTSLEA